MEEREGYAENTKEFMGELETFNFCINGGVLSGRRSAVMGICGRDADRYADKTYFW